MEQDSPCKWKPEESGISHSYIRQNRFQAKKKKVTRDNEGQYIIIKRSIIQEDKQS